MHLKGLSTGIIITLLLSPIVSYTQPFHNLEKYWVYRERVKNFLVSGDCQGCSIPADVRKTKFNEWNDSPWDLGFWIGTLAIEYHLLQQHGLSTSQTEKDLFYAIEAINRLDRMAEIAYGCSGSVSAPNNLNGFIISDNVPHDLWNQTANGRPVKDLLNENWVSPPDRFNSDCQGSAFEGYDPAREASKDHWIGLFTGFTLVKKYLPNNENWQGEQFMDGETSFVTEVQNIAWRFIKWSSTHSDGATCPDWCYVNPCTGNCAAGTKNKRVPTSQFCWCQKGNSSWCGKDPEDNCNAGGADVYLLAPGFAKANCYIQGNNVTKCILSLTSASAYNALWNSYKSIQEDDNLINGLAAISNGWGGQTTAEKMVERGKEYHFEHLILLHRILYGNHFNDDGNLIEISNDFHECFLDASPCRGLNGSNKGNKEWDCGGVNRLFEEGQCSGNGSSAFINGIGYMFYFNLYNALNQGYITNYRPLPIKNLAKQNLIVTDQDGEDVFLSKKYQAANKITSKDYKITHVSNKGTGNVTMRAGNKIVLKDGFEVTDGGYYHGYIDPAIEAMNCDPPTKTDCSDEFEDNESTNKTASVNPRNSSRTGKDKINNTQTPSFSGFSNRNIPSEPLIYPNPGNDHFHLIAPSFKESYNVQVVNSVGQTVKQYRNVTQPKLTIDIHQPGGVYIVKLQTDRQSYTKRWVKQ